jgi:hypothetical protein
VLFSSYQASSDDGYIQLMMFTGGAFYAGGWSTIYRLASARVPVLNAWNHALFVIDRNRADFTRVRMWQNGTEITATTSNNAISGATQGWQSLASSFGVGRADPASGGASSLQGRMAEAFYVDDCPREIGPETFGQRVGGGLWVPRQPPIAMPFRSFYLPLSTSSLGDDWGGNSQNFTPSGAMTRGPLERIAATYGA